MEKIKEWIPVLSSLTTIIFVLLGSAFAYGKLNQKVIDISDEVEDNKMDLNAAILKREEDMMKLKTDINETMKKMEIAHNKDIKQLNIKFDKMDSTNSLQHAELFKVSNETNVMVAKMSGYLMAKENLEKGN